MKSAALLLLLVACNATADDELRCNPNGSQSEMNMCAANDFAAADKALNTVYRDVVACSAGNPVFVGKLKDAQRQWIRFRDAELEARFPRRPGRGRTGRLRLDAPAALLRRENQIDQGAHAAVAHLHRRRGTEHALRPFPAEGTRGLPC
jgi:uncharacterized protein YecT (DUF1311 family)